MPRMAAGTPRANDLAGGTRLPCRRLRVTEEHRVCTSVPRPLHRPAQPIELEQPLERPQRSGHLRRDARRVHRQRPRQHLRRRLRPDHPRLRRQPRRLVRPDVGWPQRRRAMCGPISIGCLPARLRRKVCHPHRSGATTKPMAMTMPARCHQRPPIQLIPHRLRLDDWCRVVRGKPERNHRRSRRRAPLHMSEILDGC